MSSGVATSFVFGAAFAVAVALATAVAATESWCRVEEDRLAQPAPEYVRFSQTTTIPPQTTASQPALQFPDPQPALP